MKNIYEQSSQQLQSQRLQNYYAKVNWDAHLLPLIEKQFTAFKEKIGDTDIVTLFSDNGLPKDWIKRKNEDTYGQKVIQIGFCNRPRRSVQILKVDNNKLPIEEGAHLVFSQGDSGQLFITLYPPTSNVVKPEKPYFIIGYWENPGQIYQNDVESLLQLLWEVQIHCETTIALSNKKCSKLLRKLKKKEESTLLGADLIQKGIKTGKLMAKYFGPVIKWYIRSHTIPT